MKKDTLFMALLQIFQVQTCQPMFDHRLLTNALAELGCPKTGKLEYGIPSGHVSLQWTLSFRLIGVYRWEIDGALRCSHRSATRFAEHCLRELAGEWWKNALEMKPKSHSGSGFPVSELAPWSAMHSLKIKNLTAQESAKRVAMDIQEHVLPFVAKVQSESSYIDLLLANEKPMQWHFCQPLTRFAEIAWLCINSGRGVEPALATLAREAKFMQGQLHDLDSGIYAQRVFDAARSDEFRASSIECQRAESRTA